MTYGANIATYLADREIRAKNRMPLQVGYRTSYIELVNKRGTEQFQTPCGKNVNDFVPFYFSPSTSFAYTVQKGEKVKLIDPVGNDLGSTDPEDIVFMVADPLKVAARNPFWITNIACNSAQTPRYTRDINELPEHVNWSLYDEEPFIASIKEIGYDGVCRWFHDNYSNVNWINRTKERMAEFLVQDSFPIDLVECFVIKSTKREQWLTDHVRASGFTIPIYVKPGCFF